ncbi:hypothetical protein L1987_80710 [Smallanthus sonchifolius]|uniref:Uncharacterized protein n=1 Tax=Smallanthus sonchifolius TaxID=185202 RepID=A0ACB8YNF6_9ASTR|nr:hypothetical protein L1987_80710 [Smallanthus sonchifolius]
MKQDKAITEECIPPPEFHTLRDDMDDDDDDDGDGDGDDDDDEDDESIDNGDGLGIIYVDEHLDDHGNENEVLKIEERRKLEKSERNHPTQPTIGDVVVFFLSLKHLALNPPWLEFASS